jgi:hypothetical protein
VIQVPAGEDSSVSCYKCWPHAREKILVVPVDNNGVNNKHSNYSIASPNGIFKSIFSSLTRKSPRSSAASEEQWKIAVAELSHKLIQATRKRDEVVLEASRLKHTMAELEKKLNKLEIHRRHLLPRLHARITQLLHRQHYHKRMAATAMTTSVLTVSPEFDVTVRADNPNEKIGIVGDEVRKRGRGVWSFFGGKHGWRVKSSYSMRYSNSPMNSISASPLSNNPFIGLTFFF